MNPSQPDPDPLHGLDPEDLLSVAAQPTGSVPLAADDLPSIDDITRAFPDLEIIKLIGYGGMSAVFLARQPQLDRLVALKVLPEKLAKTPGFSERFNREGRVLARLDHPHIVTVHDFGESGGFCYLLMEHVDGVSLRQAMKAGKFTPEQALSVVPVLCDSLQFAHGHGVLHRDIKPENILLNTSGEIKIADFGIAKIVGEESGDSMLLTQSGAKLGTAPYMAPEQIEHPSEVDHRADIYSLGVVFYEMLTGELPLGRFAAPSEKSAVGNGMDEVVFRALEKERGRRQQSADEFKTEIAGVDSRGAEPNIYSDRNRPFEYQSKRTLYGMPLLHIVVGRDPATGKKREARGFFAFGDLARGVVAIGGIARGLIAIGGLAIGAISFGGCAIGIISFGGLALGLLLALGGGAIGALASGGLAVGWDAVGGLAVGWNGIGGAVHAHLGTGQKVEATHVVASISEMPPRTQWLHSIGDWFSFLLWSVLIPVIAFQELVLAWARNQARVESGSDATIPGLTSKRAFWILLALVLLCLTYSWIKSQCVEPGQLIPARLVLPMALVTGSLVIAGLALPLWFRIAPVNRYYGFCLPSVRASEERWYDVNAYFAKQLCFWSVVIFAAGWAGLYQLPVHRESWPWACVALVFCAAGAIIAATLLKHHHYPEKTGRLVRWTGQIVVAVVIAMFIKSFIGSFYIVVKDDEPGIPKGSRLFASHLDTGFSKNDLVLFHHSSGENRVARVSSQTDEGLRLKRTGSKDIFTVPWEKMVGKFLFAPRPTTVEKGTSKALDQKNHTSSASSDVVIPPVP